MRALLCGCRRACALCFLCLIATFGTAAGQEPADLTSLSIEELAHLKVFSASRYLEDPRKAPSAVTVVSAEEIQRYGWRTLGELLRSVRGFYTAYDRTYTYIGVRGFLQSGDYNARVLILIDGHRINENVYDSAMVGTEFPLDLDLIDRVEIVRGPSSSMYGTNAELGVINVITRHPQGKATVEVAGSSSSFLTRSGRLTATFEKGQLTGLLSGSLFRSAGASPLYYPDFDAPETNHGLAVDVDGDNYAHAFADLRCGNLRIQGLYGSRQKISPNAWYDTSFNDPKDRSTDTRTYADVSYRWKPGPRSDLSFRAYYDGYRFLGSYPYGELNSPDYSVQINEATADWLGAETVFGRKVGRHRFVLGASGEYNLRINQKNFYIGEPVILDDHKTPGLVAGFGEVELNLTPKLTLNLGGRIDWYDTFGTAFSPRTALIYLPRAHTSLKYVFGQAFRAPDPYDQYYIDQIDVNTPSKNLKPEEIESHTFVLEHELKPWLSLTVDGFINRLDKIIDQVTDPITGETHFANTRGDRGSGVEGELSARNTSGWAARASYTFAQTESLPGHREVMNSPSHLFKLNATMPIKHRAFAGLEMFYTGAQQNHEGTRISPSFLTNVALSTKPLWGGWEFSASCYNLFNRTWSTPTGPEVVQPATVQDGRTYRFKLSYRFNLRPEKAHK